MNKLSIIIPTYNQEKYIRETFESILNQSFQDFEIIVVNDGSTDSTKRILEEYEKKDERIKVFYQENKRLPGALNTGLKHVSGDYITWISSDSLYLSKALEVLVNTIEKQSEKIGVVFTDWEMFDVRECEMVKSEIKIIYNSWDMLKTNWIGPCFIFRKECVNKVGYYSEDLECVEDWDYWIRISEYYDLMHVPGIYVKWRDHSENMSRNRCFALGPRNKIKMLERAKERRKK